jgi:uncharacterized protein (TIGR02147 family)
MSLKKISIHSYSDFRLFVKDRLAWMRSRDQSLTLTKFADLAGLKSHSHVHLISNGTRNITDETSFKLASAFELNEKETVYFQTLVRFNQEINPERKAEHWLKIVHLLGLPPSVNFSVEQFELLASWKVILVFESLTLNWFNGSIESLVKNLDRVMTQNEIEAGLKTLDSLGLVESHENGIKLKSTEFVTPEIVPKEVVQKYYFDVLDLAKDSIDGFDPSLRNIEAISVGLSASGLEKVQIAISQLYSEIADIYRNDQVENRDTVYQINTQIFPISKPTQK